MNSSTPNRTQLRDTSIALAASVLLGASIPVLRKLFCGSADPFQSNWPLFLHIAACLAAFVVASLTRQRVMAAIGLYAGLAGYLLIVGKSEYPVASLIALAIHGFAPAVVGSLLAFTFSRRSSAAAVGVEVGLTESSRPTNETESTAKM